MDDVPEARSIPDGTVAAMVELAAPDVTVEDVTAVERGFCSIHRVATAGRSGDLYVKASPDGERWSIPDEARIQAVLDARTAIPVPAVLGAVDDHETLPAPFYVMRGLPGEAVPYEEVANLPDDALERLARETGAYLAELHGLPAVDRFGHVRHDGPALRGGRPAGDPASLGVGEPRAEWVPYLRARVDHALDRHEDSRFAALTDDIRGWCDARIQELEGPFAPALGRNDHGLHNLLVAPETGEITGMLDWGYTLAVPAAFDVEFAIYLYSGAFLAGLPGVADRRTLVRTTLLAGYRSRAPERAAALSVPEPLYELLAMVRIMNDFEHLDVPGGTEGAVTDRIRSDARAILEELGA